MNSFEPGKFYEALCTIKKVVTEGKPERTTIISEDEIVDLTILLNTLSMEEFIKII